ncbi:hypothetical protein PTTG_04795 [Puccinia triticina 1-1 BBBD Race 1]|uniref:Uncharacterized protein n=2 Tax=Puccinia triticina TaxID=208348 RepID=A0A180GEA7_PUCT1|nr:uncharacterized protein PtA15_4A576 [Puccinia triticina]OAV91020.1 hypothetical protein PTTG_04795 [Puccinia triticina 1-1 BBBD Race 1]WAQ84125.1 hypothetical protein PtA15_4A576 [Puccinia triticina]WAR54954.1 hypothetical protein PtB15_4B572 [Puccinia triticina]
MLGLASDHAQAVWQNLLLVAYASTIAAIPMGDALLFSFTAKKPLAIGVARAVFVSSLGATLTMVITFAVWLTLESIYPQLHIDHFFYQLIESKIRERSFYRILMIYILMESVMMCSTALVGGFLASITPFVGEQNQNKTKFSFSSLLMDLPLGLATISFVQVLTWCMIRYLDRFRPVSAGILQEQQERMMMMMNNQSGSTLKQSRRVTFNTTSETLIAPRCSDVSHTSSTAPILEEQPRDDAQSITRMASSSSSTTLLPHDSSHNSQSSYNKNKEPDSVPPQTTIPNNYPAEPPTLQPILNSPAVARTAMNRRPFGPHLKPGMYAMPTSNNPQISQPTPVAIKGGSSNNRFTSGALGRYAWMRSQNSGRGDNLPLAQEGPRSGVLPYSRPGVLGKANKPFGSSPYQRVSFKPTKEDDDQEDRSSIDSNEFLSMENASNEQSLESQHSRTHYARRKSVPVEADIAARGEQHLGRTEFLRGDEYTDSGSSDSEGQVDEWAETQSQLAEEPSEKGRRARFFGW